MPPHKILPGECVSSLALSNGVAPDVIWSAPGNADLRRRRDEPNVLAAGDVVDIPARTTKRVSVQAGGRYVLQLSHTHITLRVKLEDPKGPLASEPYVLTIDGREIRGQTDGDGLLEERVPASTSVARLLLPDRNEQCRLELGHLEPYDGWKGVAQRLTNLGFFVGTVGDEPSSELHRALSAFQQEEGIAVTGELDASTLDAMRERHGS